jgi:hypothetical protein
VPSTQSLSNRSLASDSTAAILRSNVAERQHYPESTGMRAPLERYCPLISGAEGAPRSCPAGSIAEVGFGSAARRRADAAAANARLADSRASGERYPAGCYPPAAT